MQEQRANDSVLAGVKLAGEWMLLAVVVGAALAAVVVPRLAGATPYAVLSGSMGPTMPAGSLVVVKPVDPADVQVGDVITYWPRENDPTVVTHRVVGVGFDTAGGPAFVTRGDANESVDATTVRGPQVVGKRWYAVPYLGHVSHLLTSAQRMLGLYMVTGGLLLYAAVMFMGAARDRVRRPRVEVERG